MKDIVVNLNGQLLDFETAKVSVFDRSYLYGDSLYEVLRTYDGRPFLLDGHLKRLGISASLCHMKLDQTLEFYGEEINRTLDAIRAKPDLKNQEFYCRLIVSRGIGKIGFGLKQLLTPTQYTILVQPAPIYDEEAFQKGTTLKVSSRLRNDLRALNPAMKSGNYLNNLLAYLEAQDEGFEDALLCNADGFVTEGTTFNVFYVKSGMLITPTLDSGILVGLTRDQILKIARALPMEVREVNFPKDRLYEADEVFISSTLREVFPVLKIDQKTISKGKPGPVTRQLAERYKAWVREAS